MQSKGDIALTKKEKPPMKPKHKVFCPQCKFKKYLFSTREKAEIYLAEVESKVTNPFHKYPIRAYYCEECDGWHVTSKRKRCSRGNQQTLQPQVERIVRLAQSKKLTLHQKIQKEFDVWLEIFNKAMDLIVCKRYKEATERLVTLVKKTVVHQDGNYYYYRREKLKSLAIVQLVKLNYPVQDLHNSK